MALFTGILNPGCRLLMMSDRKQELKIACQIHCMDPSSVKNAMQRLDADGVERIPYTCKISGNREEILLLGENLASRISRAVMEAGDSGDAKILAGLLSAELCECDVTTLTMLSEEDGVRRLRMLAKNGVLSHREIGGMNYYRLESENVRRNIEELLSGLVSEKPE
jgi:hypothetical protein